MVQLLARHNNRTLVFNLPPDTPDPFEWIKTYASTHYGCQVTHYAPPFCNFRSHTLHLRGGKGGFGTLLKGQSRQASAHTTKDFGACRDLQGRRLRNVNDELGLAVWKEWHHKVQRQTATPSEMAQALLNTPSGIAGWHLQLPAWAEVNPKKEKRRNEHLLRAWQREQDGVAAEKERKQDERKQHIAMVTQQAQTDTTMEEDRVRAALTNTTAAAALPKKKTKHSHDDDADGDDDPPAALLTISGQAVFHRHNDNNNCWRLESDSNFCTVGIFLGTVFCAVVYFEIGILVTGGLCQVGWAEQQQFRPQSDDGDGVGDDAHSWAYDGSRTIRLHQSVSSMYGGTVWEAGDVVGCLWDREKGEISYSMNGSHLGVAFADVPRKGLFPALSYNPGVVVELRLQKDELEHLPQSATPVGSLLSRDATLEDLLGVDVITSSNDPEHNPQQPQNPDEEVPLEDKKPEALVYEPLKLEDYSTHEDLEELGMDRLKSALGAIGLKCGGTLQERAQRLLLVKGLDPKDYPKKLLAKKKR